MKVCLWALAFLIMTSTSFAAGPQCTDVFSERDPVQEKNLRHYESVFQIEKLNEKELDLALGLLKKHSLSAERLLSRYAELRALLNAEIKMISTPSAMLSLSAISLTKGFEVTRVQSYIGTMLLEAKSYQKTADETSYRQHLPHRIVLRLVELAIATKRSPGEVAYYFNAHTVETSLLKRDDDFRLPVERALDLTLLQLQNN